MTSIYSQNFLFSCDKAVCIGNWQHKSLQGASPMTIQSLFDQRKTQIALQKSEQNQTLKQTQPNSSRSCDKHLEDLLQQARSILKSTQALNSEQTLFLETLFTFHPTKPVIANKGLSISIGHAYGQATFCVNNEPISIKKCLVGLQQQYLNACEAYADCFYEETQVSVIAKLLTKIAKNYPFSLPEILKNLLKTFPHQSANFEHLVVYQKFGYWVCEKLLKQCAREFDQKPAKNESTKSTTVSKAFNQFSKRQQTLKQVLSFEQQLLGKVIDRIAMLDAEVKLRGRKGAAFPSQNSANKMQTEEDYIREVSLRFYSDKEVKINLMMKGLMSYLSHRLNQFDKMQPPQCSANTYFVEPLLTIFEERLYKQAKSNFVQFIILYIVGHVGSQTVQISSNARNACKLYMERILSYLILRAFPQSGSQDVEHLTSRMQAINYLGSLMSQQVAPLPESTFLKCLLLTLDYYNISANQSEQSSQRIFIHCFISNLALVFASRPLQIKMHDQKLFEKLCNLLFHKKWSSLEFASPSTLHLLHESLLNTELGRKVCEQAERVEQLIVTQAASLKTTKVQTYNSVWRWQPYSSKICFANLDLMFDKLNNLKEPSSEAQNNVNNYIGLSESGGNTITDFTDVVMADESLEVPKINQFLSQPQPQIIPTLKPTPQKMLLKKSQQEKSQPPDQIQQPSVTQQFRRPGKYTDDQILRSQRVLQNEDLSDQSDVVTICSPIAPDSMKAPDFREEQKDLKLQKRRDIKRGIQTITSDLQALNRSMSIQQGPGSYIQSLTKR